MNMNTSNPRLNLLAVAVAASLLLAACGGGDAGAPDIFPPTVTITTGAIGTANGPVTFTFNFSETVGSSFTADDLIVSGGTMGTLTRVSDTQYTLLVTPPAGSTGEISVSVKAASFSDAAGNLNKVNPTVTHRFDTCSTTEPTCAPTTTIPTDALRIFSDATSVQTLDMAPDWGQGGQVTRQGVTIAGNNAQKYVFLGPDRLYQGIAWEGSPQNVSSKGKLHLDLWSATAASVKITLIGGGRETGVTRTLTAGAWTAVDIDLTEFTQTDLTQTIQIKLEPTAPGTLYVDNIYFHGLASGASCGTTAPTCAPSTTIPTDALRIFSDATSVGGLDMAPDWGQDGKVVRAGVTIAGNYVQKYAFAGPDRLYQGITWDSNPQNVSARGKLHLDVWSSDVTSVKISLIGGGAENGITKTLTAGAWNSLDIDLSAYTSPDLSQVIQIKLEPGTAGTLYVDNIYFHGTASGGGGGSTAFVGGVFAADYQGNLGANSAQSTLGGSVGFFFDSRLYNNKAFEEGAVVGTAVNANGIPQFYSGIGKLLPALTDAYFGAYVNAPGNGVADASAYSKIKLKFWGDAESWEKNNFTAQVDVLVQGPRDTACTNGAGRPEMLRVVSAQKTGAASEYVIPKADFTLVENCGGKYTVNSVWSSVGAVVVRLAGTNLQYVNSVPSIPVSYPTFLNMGPISFTNN